MAKLSWISSLLAATIITIILPIIYSKPQGGFQYYSDYFPKSQQRRRIDDHPFSFKNHNDAYSHGYGHRALKTEPITETRKFQHTLNTSQKPKEVFVFIDEKPRPQGKSLEIPSNIENRSDGPKNLTSNSLAENKDVLPRGKRADIVFPEHPVQPVPVLGKARPSCARDGKVFCTEIDSYPTEILENILRSSPEKYQEAFGDDIPNTAIEQRVDVRIDTEEESMCDSEEKVIHPKVGLTIENEYEYIVNFGNFTQGIRVEECKKPSTPCKMANNFPNGYKTECKQKFIYRNMLGYGKGGRVEKNLFQFPSCCQCVLKPVYAN